MRIAGITIPEKKQLWVGLTEVYGIGTSRAQEILKNGKIEATKTASELTADEEQTLKEQIEQFLIEGDLRRETAANIKRLKDIKSYRGTRHSRHLPVRGQRSKTNSRTVRGNVRKTMGSGKTKVEKK